MTTSSTEEPQGGLPRNYLRATLLLLIGEAPAHGYDLLEQVSQLGLGKVDPGGLYRALRVMERDGLVKSSWEHSSAGPARRTYELLPDGTDWLHAWAGALRESHRYLSIYLSRYDRIIARQTDQDQQLEAESPAAAPSVPTSPSS